MSSNEVDTEVFDFCNEESTHEKLIFIVDTLSKAYEYHLDLPLPDRLWKFYDYIIEALIDVCSHCEVSYSYIKGNTHIFINGNKVNFVRAKDSHLDS